MSLSPHAAAREMIRACNNRRWHIAQSLLELYGNLLVDVRGIDDYGHTPLHAAASHGQTDFMIALIDAGADVDAEAIHGSTPLYLAACNNRPNAVRLLLQAGAEPDVVCGGYTPLATAVDRGYTQVVQILLDSGAAPFISNVAGDDPLHIAARHGNVEIAQALLEAGADNRVRGADGLPPDAVAYEVGYPELGDMIRRGQVGPLRIDGYDRGLNGALVPYGGYGGYSPYDRGYGHGHEYGQLVPYGRYGGYGGYGGYEGYEGHGGHGGHRGYGGYGGYAGYAGDLSVARYGGWDDTYYGAGWDLMHGDGMGYRSYGYGLGYGPGMGRMMRYRTRSLSPGRVGRYGGRSTYGDRYYDPYDRFDPFGRYTSRYDRYDQYGSFGYGRYGRYGRMGSRGGYHDAEEIADIVTKYACRGLSMSSSDKRHVFRRVERNAQFRQMNMQDIIDGEHSSKTIARILMTDTRGHVRKDSLFFNTVDLIRSMRHSGFV